MKAVAGVVSIVATTTLALAAPVCESAEPPRVHLLATGGTIAGGATGALKAEDLFQLVPDLPSVATLSVEDFVTIGSSRMTPEIQFRLARRIGELFESDAGLAGIIVTHGTDSLEETAFFLDVLVDSDRPVVFAAAQRPPRRTDTDGPRNLLNAARIAVSPAARRQGVLITLNDEIHAALEARKTHSIALDGFKSPGAGPLGYVDGEHVVFTRRIARRLTLAPETVEPRVDLLTLVAGSDGHLVRAAVEAGARGLVLEVFGRGNVPPAVGEAVLEALERRVVVVFTTRTRGGRVEVGGEASEAGVISGQDLDGLKARMLLVVALGVTREPERLQSYFDRLSGISR